MSNTKEEILNIMSNTKEKILNINSEMYDRINGDHKLVSFYELFSYILIKSYKSDFSNLATILYMLNPFNTIVASIIGVRSITNKIIDNSLMEKYTKKDMKSINESLAGSFEFFASIIVPATNIPIYIFDHTLKFVSELLVKIRELLSIICGLVKTRELLSIIRGKDNIFNNMFELNSMTSFDDPSKLENRTDGKDEKYKLLDKGFSF